MTLTDEGTQQSVATYTYTLTWDKGEALPTITVRGEFDSHCREHTFVSSRAITMVCAALTDTTMAADLDEFMSTLATIDDGQPSRRTELGDMVWDAAGELAGDWKGGAGTDF